MMLNMDSALKEQMHKDLIFIRRAEATLAERYKQQEMRTPTHFGLGQEAVAVGVCAALRKTDVAYSHHRSHNHYLAKGGSFHGLAAELFGRETGCSRGRGGSVHLTSRENGFIASSAILAECVAAATGSALALSMDKSDNISVAFFGDAVAEEGAFYECLSYAGLKKLPVLYVCENNGYATESPLDIRQPDGVSINERVAAFKIPIRHVDGNDVRAVYVAAHDLVEAMRTNPGPAFLECETYRWLEHVGPWHDHEMKRTYRSEEELREWQQRCPLKRSAGDLIAEGVEQATIEGWEKEIQASIDADMERAYNDPWPDASQLMENVY